MESRSSLLKKVSFSEKKKSGFLFTPDMPGMFLFYFAQSFCVCLYSITNSSGLVHVPCLLYFVSNSCSTCVYRSPSDEESHETFREIMADAFRLAKQRITKNVSSKGHMDPLLDLFSFVDEQSEIPYTPRKRKSKKGRNKESANNTPDSGNNGYEREAKVEKKSFQPPQLATHT